jgi:DNA-binding NarL/FixJ family response regulator
MVNAMPKDSRQGDMILLVDDSRDQTRMLADALEHEDLTPVSAHSGEAALSMLDHVMPQLVVMDAIMPGLDGFETCRKLKTEKRFAHLPVIFMTGLKDTEHVLKGFEAGGVDYVTKPVRLEELMARIRIHISNARVASGACAALDVTGRYLIATDSYGEARWCTPQAGDLLSLSFVDVNASDFILPVDAVDQLRRLIASGEVKRTGSIGSPDRAPITVTYMGESSPDEYLFSLATKNAGSEEDVLCRAHGLTSREAEVLVWIARGKSNWEISEILLISPRTVNKHLERVFAKLGVENRASAASVALRTLVSHM